MKHKIVLIITLFSILLTGCSSSNNKEENTFIADGKAALEKHEYKDAMTTLSAALEADNTNEEARSMYMQAMRMLNVLDYEKEENYEKAIRELEAVENIKGGSSSIKNEASDKRKELKKLNEEQLKAEKERKEKAKVTAANGKYKAEQEALSANQKLEEEKALKEKAEIEEQEKAEAEANKPGTESKPGHNTPGTTVTPPTANLVPNGATGNRP